MNSSAISLETMAGKIVRMPLRLIPRNAVVRVLRGPMKGKKWIVGSSLHRCWLGSYELEFQKLLVKEVRSEGVFYDIGANVGFYSLLAADLVFPGKVCAFEPLAKNVAYCQLHIEMNGVRNVEVFQLAISDKSGQESFKTESTRAMGQLTAGGDIIVQTRTLDEMIAESLTPPPNYIKMDIEGAELRALTGARHCFSRYKPLLFLATHGRKIEEECRRLLQEWKYETSVIEEHQGDRAELIARPSN